MESDVAEELESLNESADFWRYDVGVNVIPADTVNKKPLVLWAEWQSKPVPEELHNKWKQEAAYSKGIAVIPGKVWHRHDKKDLNLIFIDADKRSAIEELCSVYGQTIALTNISQNFLVEQHKDNLDKAHVYLYSHIPFPQKGADSAIGIEIKGSGEHGIAFCSPSIHKDGQRYEIIGTNQPITLTKEQSLELIQHFNHICLKYGVKYLEINSKIAELKPAIKNLTIGTDILIFQGERHVVLLSLADSLLLTHLEKKKTDELKSFFIEVNRKLCDEPLPNSEIESIWSSAMRFTHKVRESKRTDYDKQEHNVFDMMSQNCLELFLDQYGLPYAAIMVNQHIETVSMFSKRFRNWICKLYYDKTGEVIKADVLASIMNMFKANAEFGGKTRKLHLRVADANSFYYDLTNRDWEAVKIEEVGWSIDKSPPIIFKRFNNQQAQVYPTREYPPDIFDQFMELINVKDEHNKLLLQCYIIALFIPEIPKPILMLHGEQGSAKSTLQELIKTLVDPSIIRTLAFSRDNNELVQKLSHNYVCYFDNVSDIRDWISDQLCRAVTGSGFSKRQLYTDDDDIIYNFKRCIGFNGINLGATKADLIDRGLIIQLERIPEEQRRKIEDIWNRFEKIRPQLLGYIFDTIVKVLQRRREGSIELKGYPRMADFAEVAEIIARVMGYSDNKFLDAYYRNIGLQTEEALEASPVATTTIEFKQSRTQWIGTATELLDELEQVAENLKIKTKNNRAWPSAPNRLSRRLNEVKTNLRQIGIVIERHTDSKTNTRKLEIRKVSYSSLVSPEDQKQARLDLENSGDKNTISLDVSPAVGDENHIQNDSTDDSYDTYDTTPTSSLPTTISSSIYRLGYTDAWACKNCSQSGDKWFMRQHNCRGAKG